MTDSITNEINSRHQKIQALRQRCLGDNASRRRNQKQVLGEEIERLAAKRLVAIRSKLRNNS